MSENGTKSNDFHKFCDNKEPTLNLIKTTKNLLFWGFTPLEWKLYGGDINDESNKTFIFSLNNKIKYDLIDKSKSAIQNNYGPTFGNSDLSINSDMNNGITYTNSSCNFFSNNNLELTGGKGTYELFQVEELEVYKIQ